MRDVNGESGSRLSFHCTKKAKRGELSVRKGEGWDVDVMLTTE